MNLYELSENYAQIQAMIEDGSDGLEDTLESLDEAIEDKAIGYAKVIKNLEAQSKALEEEEKRLYERRKSIDNNIKRMKESLYENMKTSGKKRIKTDLFNFNIQKNPPSVRVADEALIPKRFYVKQAPKRDNKGILQALKNDEDIPGVEIAQGEGVRIR